MFSGKSILVVDDELDLREILRDEFEFEEAQVKEAANGKEAYELIKKNKFDVVLTDIRMPGGDGVTLCREIRSVGFESPVVILITGFADIAQEEAFDLGADGFFTKPFNLEAIRNCVFRNLQPRPQRWGSTPEKRDWKSCTLPMDFEDALGQGRMSLGRGGIFFGIEPNNLKTGDYVQFEAGSDFKGCGQIRWVRTEFGMEQTPGVGIEIFSLDAGSIKKIEPLLSKATPRAFIPKK